ncbi:MAG: hypothetical protein P9L91_06800 [Candidatus Zophobacter franzmannii]|nr:hypothetical protein [Candidatus Zophobacter franzmannii]
MKDARCKNKFPPLEWLNDSETLQMVGNDEERMTSFFTISKV